jgi:hypothetical protein
VPVTDLDGQAERGQRRDPTQTPQSLHNGGELAVDRRRGDGFIKPIPTVHTSHHRVQRRFIGQRQRQVIEVLPA